jgi:N-acetylglucosaminyldiphosphoundecaprenol N-acetyl-beta-D-mannosaminyltransferase
MPEQIHILNTKIHNLSLRETMQIVEEAIVKKKQIHHTVVNAGKIVAMQKDKELRESVNGANIVNADGQAVVWASEMLKKPLKERVAGIDLFQALLKKANEKNYTVYLLGAEETILGKLTGEIQNSFGQGRIAGAHHGFFPDSQETRIVQNIAESGADMLFVAMSSPRKENFLHRNREALKNIPFIMGVGGSFDVMAGKTKRAPKWMQNAGLEWFYRFQQEPRRMWKRYLVGNSKFISLVFKEKLKQGKQKNTLQKKEIE